MENIVYATLHSFNHRATTEKMIKQVQNSTKVQKCLTKSTMTILRLMNGSNCSSIRVLMAEIKWQILETLASTKLAKT